MQLVQVSVNMTILYLGVVKTSQLEEQTTGIGV